MGSKLTERPMQLAVSPMRPRSRQGPGDQPASMGVFREQALHRQPMFWGALCFSAGLWWGLYAWRPPLWWATAISTFIFAGCWFVSRRRLAAWLLALAAWFLFGAFLIQVCRRPPEDQRLDEFSDGEPVVLTAHVIRGGYARAKAPGSTSRSIDVESEQIEQDRKSLPVRAGIRLSLYDRGETLNSAWGHQPVPSPALSYGERIRVSAKLHRPRNFRNPGAFDYEGYLREDSISLLGSASMDDVERMPGFLGSRVALWRARVHASIISKIHQLWPASQATLMDAMVLGEESFLSNATRAEFQRSGTYHLLVVSGMNLSILAFAIFWALRKMRLDPALAAVATVAVSFTYAFVVGVGPPVWRAALMLAIYLGARLLYRGRNMLNAIGAAAIGVLIADPHALFGASFQLTFPGGVHHRRHRGAITRTKPDPVFPRAAVARGDQLRPSCCAERGAVPAGSTAGRRTLITVHRKGSWPVVAAVVCTNCNHCRRTHFHLCSLAGGSRTSHGVLLPPRNDHGNASEFICHSAHPAPDARCRGCHRSWLCFTHAGKTRRVDLGARVAGNYGNRALARWRTNGRRVDC